MRCKRAAQNSHFVLVVFQHQKQTIITQNGRKFHITTRETI